MIDYGDGQGLFDDYYCGDVILTEDADGNVIEDETEAAGYTFKNKVCLWFANMGMPIPKLAKDEGVDDDETILDQYASVEFWSAIFEFRPFQAATVFSISNSFFFTLLAVFAFYRYQNLNGFEGFAYNENENNREEIEPLDW